MRARRLEVIVGVGEAVMRGHRAHTQRRRMLVGLLVCVAVAGVTALGAGSASAQFGQGFGLADAAGPAGQEWPLPDTHSFWAGTCALAQAPPPDGSVIPGGVGARQPTMFRKVGNGAAVNPAGPFDDMTQMPSPATPSDCIDHGAVAQGVPAWVHPPEWRQAAVTEAGAHPDGSVTFTYARQPGDPSGSCKSIECFPSTNGSVDNIRVDLPAGFMGNPQAVAKCSGSEFSERPVQCPPASQIGVATIALINSVGGITSSAYPVYNLEPRKGKTAEFGIPGVGSYTNVTVQAKARTNGDFGVATFVGQIPAALDLYTQTVTLWGIPWEAANNKWRPRQGIFGPPVDGGTEIPLNGLAPADRAGYHPSWGPVRPFISNPTECSGAQLSTGLATDSFQAPAPFTSEGYPRFDGPTSDNWKRYASAAPPVTDCQDPPFGPDMALSPTTDRADAPTGLEVELSLPQNDDQLDDDGDPVPAPPDDADPGEVADYLATATAHWRSPEGRATAHLDKAVVELPAGVAVNPAGAAGLAGCSDAGIGLRQPGNPSLFNDGDPFNKDGGADGAECPDGSKVGTVRVQTPLFDEPLDGVVVLGEPHSTDPASGEMFRLFLVVVSAERGLVAKVYGSAVADPRTGQLTATFDRNPRVPFERMTLRFKGGDRAQLAMPQDCGIARWSSTFTPWTAAHDGGGQPVTADGEFAVGGDCSLPFAPTADGGMSARQGGAHGTFTLEFARRDGEQWIRGLEAELPAGLLARIRGVPLCRSAQAAAGACPPASRIGTVDAAAGSGTPFFLERKGDVYLTEGYKGGAYGLMVRVPVEAGPFRGKYALDPIVVRQALHVDRSTARVTAISDPFPEVWHGIPLRVRKVTVTIDRPRFMLNPSGCAPKQISARFESARGQTLSARIPFQPTGCAALPFKPRLAISLTGRKQTRTGRHPGVRAAVRQTGIGEAGIRKARVVLPPSLALDPENAQALCEFDDGTRPDLENHCPKGSIVGRARAITPLLDNDLVGDVYFVKNVRRDPTTGNLIRTLPMIVVALRGEIAINLVGRSTTTRNGRLVNTFDEVPDAPITRFNLNIAGGAHGILAVTGNRRGNIDLCRKPRRHIAQADIDGHNGRRADQDITVKPPCTTRRPARLRLRHTKWRHGRLTVAGAVAPNAKRPVRIALRCRGARIARTAKPTKQGAFKRTLPARRCRTARARLVIAYPGDRTHRPARLTKQLKR